MESIIQDIRDIVYLPTVRKKTLAIVKQVGFIQGAIYKKKKMLLSKSYSLVLDNFNNVILESDIQMIIAPVMIKKSNSETHLSIYQ